MADPRYPRANADKPAEKAKFDYSLGEASDPDVSAFSDQDPNAVKGTRPHHTDKRDADWSGNDAVRFPGTDRPID